MALASPCLGLKSPIPNEYNIGQLLSNHTIHIFYLIANIRSNAKFAYLTV
jgi:hypothetical protein